MILFVDTSALVKFFHREEGTDVVVSIISDLDNEVWVSELARLEFIRNNLIEGIRRAGRMVKLVRKSKHTNFVRRLPGKRGRGISRRFQFGQHLPKNIPLFAALSPDFLLSYKLM